MAHNGVNGTIYDDEDIDYSDIEAKYQVEYDESFDNILVVDGVPVIDKSKLEKLLQKISKDFSRKGCPIKPENMTVPWNESNGKSKGYIFMEFKNPDDASRALAAMNGHPFDARHTFLINRFTDFERYLNLDETYVEPPPEEYKPKEHLRAWLGDPQGRDQYATYRGDDVEIHWHGKPSQCEVAYSKPNWTDLYVSWSPMGTYFASLHRQGVRLWGGPSWEPQSRFAHPLVKLIDFSPNEQYLVTWSYDPIVVREGAEQGPQYFAPEDEGNNIAVWDIKTGHLLRTFPSVYPEGDDQKKQMAWPALKWSPDDKYVARVTPGQQISVYELPGMGLQGKKSIKIEGVVDFEWRPLGDRDREEIEKENQAGSGKTPKKARENMLAFWTPEVQNQPARVSLMSFPSRETLRQKNLFNVSECKLYWQNQGDFLCVKVDRHTKTKKSIFCNLEIFRVREKDFPVEVVELKDTVTDFSWEPKGERFALVSSSDPNLGNPGPGITIKTDVSFYQHERSKGDFKLLKSLPGRTSNTVRWSPRGRHVVLATVGSSSKSELEFWDLDFSVDETRREGAPWGSGIQHLGTADHYALTDAEWDPSGRYIATSASAWRHTLENGYAIWDFRGQELEKHILDRFKQFLWRPRPPSLLTKEQQKQIRRNLKEYSRVFDEEDAAEESNVSAELIAHRKRLIDEWNAWRQRCREEVAEERRKRGKKVEPAKEKQPQEEQEEIEVWVDEVIEQIEEEVVE
ncbi:translation initiation factor eIF-3b [Dichomitus squalens]|uniref:Eukaryotic translation initiation factor 3 subunit B n=2 Tax=Dichomitus squalens TaxID=114155 RepID=A0A4Q9Q8F3_9APHY|nr:translation initiation factor eIF-3b [Dichomitus squalens LYAD-421 SS1]EJF62267.1 translation initiation factor eIF-3b [Dichomitus squalens LYAD-421 SS1]TBU46388.1 translation initiation factor eIF-3b [Dichomitus squalens]TBU63291.1 translation initiation factor eIF-3b [Dichomitus squalens]